MILGLTSYDEFALRKHCMLHIISLKAKLICRVTHVCGILCRASSTTSNFRIQQASSRYDVKNSISFQLFDTADETLKMSVKKNPANHTFEP